MAVNRHQRALTKDLPNLWATELKAESADEVQTRGRVNTQELGSYFSQASPAPIKKSTEQPRLKVEGAVKTTDKAKPRKACEVCKQPCNLRCGACKQMWYCSVECQTKHWETHMDECIDETIAE
eukprot:gb/GEZN01016781.1/.p1 GENE.gb/GEZN01016781.1/~~gb/GEZN01016781.1/.p1  ORF type:complete len:124 (-),score=11.79 gb/GEZN01016781.1/:421-792(-)